MDFQSLARKWGEHNLKGKSFFVDRRKGKDKLCLLLAGYKEQLWPEVLPRFKRFLPDDVEVCLLSSGKKLKVLDELAEENGWSYLSTKKNNVCLAQNIAIDTFPEARLIWKIDEDMFLTEGVFGKMESAMTRAEERYPVKVGMAVPLININAYGYRRILEHTGALEAFESRFGEARMVSGQKSPIESDIQIARFLWGETGDIPQLDDLNRQRASSDLVTLCPVRFSIGCVVYRRDFWDMIMHFPVVPGNGIGLDEAYALGAAQAFSRPLAVAEDSVVGHFGYGPQTEKMMELYRERPELFHLKEV